MMPLLNYTTKIPYEKSMAQIEALLILHGARDIYKKVDGDGFVYALIFSLSTPQGSLPISLPIDAEATLKVLDKQWRSREISKQYATKDRARRIAWRIIKDWLEAQIWLVETEMAKFEQIMLPYLMVNKKQTLYEAMQEKNFLLVEGGDKEG